MAFYSNNITFFKQCFYCKRTDHKELMCWNKYLHKKKKFKMTKKKKNEKPKSDNNSEDNFSDNFTSNSTFNSIFKLFLNMKSSAFTLNFMSVINQHSLSV